METRGVREGGGNVANTFGPFFKHSVYQDGRIEYCRGTIPAIDKNDQIFVTVKS